jgi:hypothetical protein
MTRSVVVALSLTAASLALAGCGSEAGETNWSPEAAQYAIYATRIPLYPGTKIEDAMGSERYGADPGSYSYGMTWWCTARATRDELRTWYEAKLPTATRATDDDGHVVLTVVPEGAGPREDMGVLIEADGKYRVFEHTRQKKPGT